MRLVVIATFALLVGCSDDTTSTTSTTSDAGTSSDGAAGTLYDRLGKNAGIKAAVDEVVKDELADPEIAAFFAGAGTGGRPSADQIKECLVAQLGNAAGGPERYPTTVSGGFTCRSMKAAHANLGISSTVFDKFVTIAAGTLKRLKVADADIATVGSVLNSTKPDVVGGG